MMGAALSSLTTGAKTVVGAINELVASLNIKQDAIPGAGDAPLLAAPEEDGAEPVRVPQSTFFKSTDIIPVAKGGTGAATASGARQNLGVGVPVRWGDLYPAPAAGDFIAYLSALPLNSVTNLFMLANNANRAMTGIPENVLSGASLEREGLFIKITKANDSNAAELFLQQDQTIWIGRFHGSIVYWASPPARAFAYDNNITDAIIDNAPTYSVPDFYTFYITYGGIIPSMETPHQGLFESLCNGTVQRFSYPQDMENQTPPEAVVYQRGWDMYNEAWTPWVRFEPASM
jgi:hypothetical protein